MKKIFSLILICIMLTACGSKYQLIDSNKAMTLIEDGAIVIDVREVDEYNTGYIEGAVNIPLGIIYTVDYNKDKPIIVYCASGMRSMEAAKQLYDMGYTNLYNLDGGLINWGFELVK